MTVISNEQCIEQLKFNSTRNSRVRQDITEDAGGNPAGIPYGLSSQFLCTQGMQNEDVSKTLEVENILLKQEPF